MVKTRRSVNGEDVEINYSIRSHSKVDDEQEDAEDGWTPRESPRELRSHYRLTKRKPHWSRSKFKEKLRTIKMPRIVYPESEDTEPEKYSRRRRPMRVFFNEVGGMERRSGRPVRSTINRELRPLQPNNYMEDSDKPSQEDGIHVRRSGRQRKLIHHTFNESWITNELKVKGYPRLFGQFGRLSPSSSESSSEDERPQQNRRNKSGPHSNDEFVVNGMRSTRRMINYTKSIKKENLDNEEEDKDVDAEKRKSEEKDADGEAVQTVNGEEEMVDDIGKSEANEDKVQSNDNNETEIAAQTSNIRSLRQRRTRNIETVFEAPPIRHRGRPTKKNQSNQRDSSDSESSDTDSETDVQHKLRRSNRTRKPRTAYIATPDCKGDGFKICRKTYSLRERKQPKILVRSQTSSSSASSGDTEDELNVSVKPKNKPRQKIKAFGDNVDKALKDIQPIELDGTVRFSSVGGLDDHIRCLREMVLFPLLYPQVFEKFGTQPPRGVLFHGPPGTGKTLLARALANECSLQGGQKVSFFMRKGADCLKKYVGESERNIKLLFQQAAKMKPSIIFFDEIDALAPVRSVRQEQVHTSVVGTLLAEMDGICDRGSIIIIGATNRLDAVDPALRRAGRLDRELHFPAPAAPQRADILRIHTKQWKPQPRDDIIKHIADITVGYGGSDLKALCSEAVLRALERTYPQVYKSLHALVIDPYKVDVTLEDMVGGMQTLVVAGSRVSPPASRCLAPHLRPLLTNTVQQAFKSALKVFPFADKSIPSQSILSLFNHCVSSMLLIMGDCASSHIGPAVLSIMEHCPVKEISLATLHQGLCYTPEQAILATFADVRRSGSGPNGCILYAPEVDLLWKLLGDNGAALMLHQWREVSMNSNCLLVATYDGDYKNLPDQIKSLFPINRDCIFNVKDPSATEIANFFKPLFTIKALDMPPAPKQTDLVELPRAPPPPPPQPSQHEKHKQERREAHILRELRIFLRDVCRKLAANRRFYKFTKPVDLEEVTDYLDIIKQPMDLETIMTKVDMHRYNCARDFLQDIDLICANALEYNPDRTSSDKQIRHEACSLRDHAHALIDVEMDSDFEDECRAIADRRAVQGTAPDKDLPNFIFTPSNHALDNGVGSATSCNTVSPPTAESNTEIQHADGNVVASDSLLSTGRKRKKRKKTSLWSKGIAKKHKPSGTPKESNIPIITDEESKENKPLCESPIPEESVGSRHDNKTSESVGSHGLDSISPHLTGSPHATTTALIVSPTGRDDKVTNGSARKLHLDDVEMLLDSNTVDSMPKKILDSHPSPSKQSDRRNSGAMTSTPKKKLSTHEESLSTSESQIIINRLELESVHNKCLKALRNVRLKPLLELYSQLEIAVNLYKLRLDRSNLPSELQNIIDKFSRSMS